MKRTYIIAVIKLEEQALKSGDLIQFTSNRFGKAREVYYRMDENKISYLRVERLLDGTKPIEVLIVSNEVPIGDAIGKDVVMINRKPHLIIGKAPKNIIDDLLSRKRKEGDEVEVVHEFVASDSVVDTVSGKIKPFSPSPKINAGGTVECL